jgi:ethanolaminephosphotransferase
MRLTKAHLAGVDQYKYSGMDKSVVSKHVLGPYWTWLVTLFPTNLAPNAVSGAASRLSGVRMVDVIGP